VHIKGASDKICVDITTTKKPAKTFGICFKKTSFWGVRSKEWPGKMIYLNFDSIFGDFFLKFFEEEVSDYLS